jgi:hypothetical protein
MNALKIVTAAALLGLVAFFVWRHLRPRRLWVTSQHTYESFPLFLRQPTNVDTPTNRQRFPRLAVVTHEFSRRYPDGRPEPGYNETLFDFDIAITSSFDSPPRGVPILVETFGGFRHYYFCVATDTDLAAAMQPVVQRFPEEKLTWEYRKTGGWDLLDKYSEESLSAITPPVSFQP